MADECMEHALAFAINSSSTAAQHWLVPLPPSHNHNHEHQDQDAAALQQLGLGAVQDDGVPLPEDLGRSVLLALEASFLRGVIGDQEVLLILSTLPHPGDADAYRDGGFGGVPAPAAAVAGLEKHVHHQGGEGQEEGRGMTTDKCCVICVEDFVAGDELAVMPCSHKHSFHWGCIAEWLGRSNACPLCRHALPSS